MKKIALISFSSLALMLLFQNFSPSQSTGGLNVFVVGSDGLPLPVDATAYLTTVLKYPNQTKFEKPVIARTFSNSRLTQKIESIMAGSELMLGLYVPIGFSADWSGFFDCSGKAFEQFSFNYSPYVGSSYEEDITKDSSKNLLTRFTIVNYNTCVVFKLNNEQSNYIRNYGKINSNEKYVEIPFVKYVTQKDELLTNFTKVSKQFLGFNVGLSIAEDVGGTIQQISITDPSQAQWPGINLIKNAHPTDSGLQWSVLLKNLTVGNLPPMFTAFNQAIGGDDRLMWGFKNPLNQLKIPNNRGTYFRTHSTLWIPLYSDFATAQKIDEAHPEIFQPRAPLFKPRGLHLFDGRVSEISLQSIALKDSAGELMPLAQVTSMYQVRAHTKQTFNDIKMMTIQWGSYQLNLEYKPKIYLLRHNPNDRTVSRMFIGDDETKSSFMQDWMNLERKINTPGGTSYVNVLTSDVNCDTTSADVQKHHCKMNSANFNGVLISYEYNNKNYSVLIRKQKFESFNSEISFQMKGFSPNPGFSVHLLKNSSLTLTPEFTNGEGDDLIYNIGEINNINAFVESKLGRFTK